MMPQSGLQINQLSTPQRKRGPLRNMQVRSGHLQSMERMKVRSGHLQSMELMQVRRGHLQSMEEAEAGRVLQCVSYCHILIVQTYETTTVQLFSV